MLSAHPRDEIAELLDGRLAGARAAEVVAHVEGCAACRNELQALRLVKVSLGRLRDVASPADLLPRLAAVLDEEDRRVCSARRRSRWRGRPWTA
jgi:anti-sigma factor RsiW